MAQMWISYYNAGLIEAGGAGNSSPSSSAIFRRRSISSPACRALTRPLPNTIWRLLPVQQFPAILLTPDTVTFDEEANCTLHQTMRLSCVIAVTHQDRNTLAEMAQDYARAVRAVLDTLWESTPGDFLLTNLPLPSPPFPNGALSPGLASGKLMKIFAEGHTFDEVRRRPAERLCDGSDHERHCGDRGKLKKDE